MSSFLLLRRLKQRNIYYFRRKVPVDLHRFFNRSEIRASLKTSSTSTAKLRGSYYLDTSERLFFILRTNYLSDMQKRELVSSYISNSLSLSLEVFTPHTLQAASTSPLPAETSGKKTIGELVEQYLKENTQSKKWTEKTSIEYENTFDTILSVTGKDKLMSTFTRQDLVQLRETLRKLPVNLHKSIKYRGKSIQQILKMRGYKKLTIQTVNKHMTRLHSFFKWSFENEYIPKNIASNLKIKEDKKPPEHTLRNAYSKIEIVSMLQQLPTDSQTPERFWIPLIALFTGMRQNEICQLYREDVRLIDGLWCFDINNDKDKLLKNNASIRVVPIHPHLIEIGFIDYYMSVQDKPRLWMNLLPYKEKYNDSFSDWFMVFNRKHITEDSKKVFHSFRHSFAHQLKEAHVDHHIIAELLGHKHGSITFDRYAKRYETQTLYEGVCQLDYGINYQHIHWKKIKSQ